jgi:large-conductance mechanosensitive channel
MNTNTESNKNVFDFTLKSFISFLRENNVIAIAIASILSERVNDLTNNTLNGLIMPIINRDIDGDGTPDIKKIEDYELTLIGTKFQIGKIVMSIIKFIIVSYIVFYIANQLKKIEQSI